MSKRFIFILLFLLSAMFLPFQAYAGEQMTAKEFQDLCSSAPVARIREALDQMGNSAFDPVALMCASALNPDPEVISFLANKLKSNPLDVALAEKGKTALMYAAEMNSPEVVLALVNEGANISIKDENGNTALDYALKNHNLSENIAVLTLLGYGADEDGPTPAAFSDDVKPIEDEPTPASFSDDVKPIEDEPTPAVFSDDVKPIENEPTHVAFSDDVKPVEDEPTPASFSDDVKPIEDEPTPAVFSDDVKPIENEPTHVAFSDDVKPVENEPTPANVPGISADDFRRMCAGASSEMIINALENRNADANAADYYDVTPLMYAAEKNSDPKVIDALVSFGAKTDAKDKDGRTALMYAAKSNPSPEIISALTSNGANVNARDSNRMTALMYAARNNNAKTVKALIDAGAEELADKRGWTPLFWAARYTNDPEVIGVLLDAGHDPQIRAHDMATPIDHANRNPRLINTKDFMRLEEESR